MHRYIPNTSQDVLEMFKKIGIQDIEELFIDIPQDLKFNRDLNLESSKSEIEVKDMMNALASKNKNLDQITSFLGAGVYDHFVPSLIPHLAKRSEFYTAYTPYQPEISQGTLQVIFEYQSMICELTGMDGSNASMYDGPTAAAEAIFLAESATNRSKVLVSKAINPEIRKVIDTYTKFRDIEIIEVELEDGVVSMEDLKSKMNNEIAGLLVQSPNFFGIVEDLEAMSLVVKANKGITISYVDPISLSVLEAPGNLGVDIAIGDGQSLGNGLSFGGPYLGFMAVKEKLIRKLPGRIVGQSLDVDGKRAFVLTLQAREQHIRRYKATSNICSNQGLNTLIATIYMTIMGKEGMKEVAMQSMSKAHYAYEKMLKSGKFTKAFNKPFFKEFTLIANEDVNKINEKLMENGILGGYNLSNEFGIQNGYLVAVTEKRTKEQIDRFVEVI
jgi:glycine dehydrogenase subunit 1